jgi:hypothetical protein
VHHVERLLAQEVSEVGSPPHVALVPHLEAVHRHPGRLELGDERVHAGHQVRDLDVEAGAVPHDGRRRQQSLGAARVEALDEPEDAERSLHPTTIGRPGCGPAGTRR